jgi:hypothetical protein
MRGWLNRQYPRLGLWIDRTILFITIGVVFVTEGVCLLVLYRGRASSTNAQFVLLGFAYLALAFAVHFGNARDSAKILRKMRELEPAPEDRD